MTKNATYCDKHVSSRKCIFFVVQPRGHDPPRANNEAQALVDQARARREAELAAQQQPQRNPSVSVEAGMTSRTVGVPCLAPALRNEWLPKDFKGP